MKEAAMNSQAYYGHQDEVAGDQWRWRLQTLWALRAIPALAVVALLAAQTSLRVLS
jgi:hypothetical protein